MIENILIKKLGEICLNVILSVLKLDFSGVWIMTGKQKDMRLDKQTETALKIIMDAAPVGIVVFGSDSRIIYGNPAASKLFGKQATEIFGLRCGDFIDCSKRPEKSQLCGQTESCPHCSLFRAICAALSDDAIEPVQEGETLLERDSGLNAIWVKYKVGSIELKGTKVAIMTVDDVTDRKCGEAAIKEAHQRLLTVLDSMDAGIYVADMETYELLFVNRFTQNIYGNIVGKKCWQTLQEGRTGPCEFCTNDKLLDTDGLPTGVYQWEIINTKTGRWYECRDNALRWIDRRMVRLEIALDITDRKQAEEAIKTSLREKETLLKELHHRVKNNMQVISSLLNLQMMRNQDERVKKALMDCRGRINSMASIHEMLYASDSLSVIDCHTYFSKLTRDILHSYHPSLQRVKLTVDAKGVTLGIQQSLPLGLMINELLSNALKYGFRENMHGHIMIHLKACEQDMLEFVFSDNGIGIPQDIDWRKTGSLGLNLIVLLAENQLGGTVSLDRAKGTRFTIKFRREEL